MPFRWGTDGIPIRIKLAVGFGFVFSLATLAGSLVLSF
jgi:hypothetical protein